MERSAGKSTRGSSQLSELFARNRAAIKSFFLRKGLSLEDAEDLTQETFLKASKAFGGFRGDAKPRTWLFSIAKNVWRNWLRETSAAKRHGDDLPLDDGSLQDDGASPEDRLADKQNRRALLSAIGGLPAQMRRCVQGRLDDRKHGEIAADLGISVATVKSQFSLARKRLLAALAAALVLAAGLAWIQIARERSKLPEGEYQVVEVTGEVYRDAGLSIRPGVVGLELRIAAGGIEGPVSIELRDAEDRVVRREDATVEGTMVEPGQREIVFRVATRSLQPGRTYVLTVRRAGDTVDDEPLVDMVFSPYFDD